MSPAFQLALSNAAFQQAMSSPALYQAMLSPAFQLALSSSAFQVALEQLAVRPRGLRPQGSVNQLSLQVQGSAASGLAAQRRVPENEVTNSPRVGLGIRQ